MIVISFTVACANEDVANRIHLLMPSAENILREEGVSNVSIMWTADEDDEE